MLRLPPFPSKKNKTAGKRVVKILKTSEKKLDSFPEKYKGDNINLILMGDFNEKQIHIYHFFCITLIGIVFMLTALFTTGYSIEFRD